ncbi:hypothetical protein CACET_c34820 [Clostridium aceticum]|uniref:Uncharacterized protein n=1 Tax=Clostridium aceticum TaxID=84022 RepID=A0A0D8I5I9_9CLOT|nr:hypothetical protein [Clostridium aceticum]AKL96925.1 hypothetical protein CACET_c34820 [Clostridium aceticum]KJF25503.1 hypothetical protein TZ02_18410 [Clostridium aceticum]
MWVRSQNKKVLGNYELFAIPTTIGSKKTHIQGIRGNSGFFESNTDTLGEYPCLEEAIEELNNLQEALKNNPHEVYEMK